jgi:hypothetical protein
MVCECPNCGESISAIQFVLHDNRAVRGPTYHDGKKFQQDAYCNQQCLEEHQRNGISRAESALLAAAAVSGLVSLFQTLNLDTDPQSLIRAMKWLKHQGADTVADLKQLRPGTYTCKDLADGLSLPMIKAHRLLLALEGPRCPQKQQSAKPPAPSQPIDAPIAAGAGHLREFAACSESDAVAHDGVGFGDLASSDHEVGGASARADVPQHVRMCITDPPSPPPPPRRPRHARARTDTHASLARTCTGNGRSCV